MQYRNLGNFIRNKRQAQNHTLNSFAFESEIDPASLSRFETGKGDILLSNFLKIINTFGATPSDFFKEYEEFSQ